jgi:hypothetical protein
MNVYPAAEDQFLLAYSEMKSHFSAGSALTKLRKSSMSRRAAAARLNPYE